MKEFNELCSRVNEARGLLSGKPGTWWIDDKGRGLVDVNERTASVLAEDNAWSPPLPLAKDITSKQCVAFMKGALSALAALERSK